MARKQKPIEYFRDQITRNGHLMSTSKRLRFQRIVDGLCVECGQLPKPKHRRCEVCALNNLARVNKSNNRGER